MTGLSMAWKLASDNIKQSQDKQKKNYDRSCTKIFLKPGDRVMVYMPAEKQGKDWKLSRPFHGPYRVLKVTQTNAEVRLVDQPTGDTLFVNLDRIRPCYPEQGNEVWVGPTGRKKKKSSSKKIDSHKEQNTPHV